MLNFGHTLGHALENQYELIAWAGGFNRHDLCLLIFPSRLPASNKQTPVIKLLEQYGLPTYASFDKQKAFEVLKMDKKRERKEMNYVLLEKIGKGIVKINSVKSIRKDHLFTINNSRLGINHTCLQINHIR